MKMTPPDFEKTMKADLSASEKFRKIRKYQHTYTSTLVAKYFSW